MTSVEDFFERQRDGLLNEVEIAELVQLLNSPAERRAWWRLSTSEGALREALSIPRSPQSGPQSMRGPARRQSQPRASRPWVWASVGIVTLVALLVTVRLATLQPTADTASVATIITTETAEIRDGVAHRLVVGERIGAGAHLHGACTVSLPDGSLIMLADDAELQVAASPGAVAHLSRGTITVEAAQRKAGSALIITTPHAEVSVLGTRFHVAVDIQTSKVTVDHGRVGVAAIGSLPVEVGPGEYAEASPGKPTWHWQPPVPAWRVDIAGHEAELIKDGWLGEARADGLGAGPGVVAINGVSIFTMATPEKIRAPGLVRFTPDLQLHVLLSLDRPSTLLIQVQLGTPGPQQWWLGNYQKNLLVQPCTREDVVIPWADLEAMGTAMAKVDLKDASVYRVLVMQAVSDGGLVVHSVALSSP